VPLIDTSSPERKAPSGGGGRVAPKVAGTSGVVVNPASGVGVLDGTEMIVRAGVIPVIRGDEALDMDPNTNKRVNKALPVNTPRIASRQLVRVWRRANPGVFIRIEVD
jgi:hypothetical protein